MSEDGIPNVESIIGAIAAKHGILFKPSDAAFALVTINEMLLERSGRELVERIDRRLKEFESSFERLQVRAGTLLAQDIKEAAEEISEELHRDMDADRVSATELVLRVEAAHTRWALVRWAAIGLVCGAVLFGSGVWFGLHHIF